MGYWRLLKNICGNGFYNMAVDEAILICRLKGVSPNTIRLYWFIPSCVTIGYFQSVEEEVNFDQIKALEVDLTRRITGGGAVFHDSEGEVTYSVVAGRDSGIPQNIMESYEYICRGLVYACEKLGLKAVFSPVNDVLVNGRKVSGSAQTRRKNVLLQHGTLMYRTDLNKILKVLRIPAEKIRDKGVKSIRERVTTLSLELGRKISREEVLDAMIMGFEEALNADVEVGGLSSEEEKLVNELMGKYSSREWVFKR